MDKLIIDGNKKLSGKIDVQGSKNGVLPILAATILCSGESVIHNCPNISDVNASIKILNYLGCSVKKEGTTLIINACNMSKFDIPDSLMREMRSSIIFLGAIISKKSRAKLSFPGGCELGPRPIDLHLKALKQLGVDIKEQHGIIDCIVTKKLQGTSITLSFPSVGATENLLLASVFANGETIITNAAREPEICDLALFLNKCGAKIKGAGEGTIVINGVNKLYAVEHKVIPDRIVATTFMAAAGITGGKLLIKNVVPEHIGAVIPVFEECGCDINIQKNQLKIEAPNNIMPIKMIRTMPYPGFPTDAQALLMAMCTIAKGTSVFTETVFESRYKHVGELTRLGASIKVEGKVAVVEGGKKLSGATVEASDLRGAAALVVAGLAAEGKTTVLGISHIDRGYDNIEGNLSSVGAVIKRI